MLSFSPLAWHILTYSQAENENPLCCLADTKVFSRSVILSRKALHTKSPGAHNLHLLKGLGDKSTQHALKALGSDENRC